MDKTCDVVVVGAGPAGLVAAQITAKAGLKTIVYEKNEAIGIPIRSSGGSWISDLNQLGIPAEFYHPIGQIKVITGKQAASFAYPKPMACVLDVRRLYQYLGEQAVASGAAIQLKTHVDRPLINEGILGGVISKGGKMGDEEATLSKIVIDASGYAGLIGKRAGANPGYKSFGFGAEYDLYAPDYDETEAYLFLGSVTAPNGYGWAFPYGHHRVRLGVGVMRPNTHIDPRDYLDRLLSATPDLSRCFRRASPIEFHIGLFPVYPPVGRKFVQDGLVMVGDAAGQGSSLLGEGIRYAIASGKMAGQVVVDAFTAQNFTERFLKSYERQWKAAFLKDSAIAYWIGQRIARFSDQDWDNLMPFLGKLTPYQMAMGLKCDFNLGWLASAFLHNPVIALKILSRVKLPG
jgi:digeranylgeranylglycerophospholipid reductase